jgi:hypothetical protein
MATEIAETEYYDLAIDDPLLTEYGFTKFRIPINSNATRMELYNNKDRSMIIYPEFDKHHLDKSVKLLEDKLVKEQLVEGKAGKDLIEGLVAYFRNKCIELKDSQDTDFEFFKKPKKSKRKPKSGSQDVKKEIFAQRYAVDEFGAKHSDSRREKRKLVFDQTKLERLGKIYELSINVKVGTSVTDVTDVTDVGLDKHIQENYYDKEIANLEQENTNF